MQFLSISVLLTFGLIFSPAIAQESLDNLALSKNTTQSSVGWGGVSSKAVDGNTSGHGPDGSITHTKFQPNSWWRVDLGKDHNISSIQIHNRTDCCTTRLNGAKVYVGKINSSNPADYSEVGIFSNGAVQEFQDIGLVGRYVLVHQSRADYLSLAEVRVFGTHNLALSKNTTQSSVRWGGVSSKAVDGNTSGHGPDGSITHTNLQANAWWRVDLGEDHNISSIQIHNRTDCCTTRLNGAKVYVGQINSSNPADYSEVGIFSNGSVQEFQDIGLVGRYVLVHQSRADYLSLAEVRVFGTRHNIALSKTATQSSVGYGGVPSRAVDDNTSGYFPDGSITHTKFQPNSWWRVDLGKDHNISSIQIHNRTDCCTTRLNGAKVYVGKINSSNPADYSEVGIFSNGSVQEFQDIALVGRYVLVHQSRANYLSLAEVKVFGTEVPEIYGTIMLRHSGKCINVPWESQANGVGIIQSTCASVGNDRFALRKIGDNAYNIVAEHSGKCLRISGASLAEGASVVQWPCSSQLNGNAAYRLEPIKNGHRIVARHSGRCLNIKSGTAANNGELIQSDCVSADNEIFTITALGSKQGGRWSSPIKFPLVPVAASVMSTGEILTWSAYGRMGSGGNRGYTMTALYDPDDGSVTERRVSETGHDMFCPGTTQMGDGRLMVTGGSSSGRVSIYEPLTSIWTRAPDMNLPRAYHSSTVLGDGSIMVVGGSWAGGIGDKGAEVFRNNQWTLLSGVSTIPMLGADPRGMYRSDNHMWLFPWTGNRVFQAGPSRQMHMISSTGNGSVSPMGPRGSDNYAMNGSAVMFAPGRILTTGGATSYDNGVGSTNAIVIDINGGTVTTDSVEPMQRGRTFHHSVVLPDGQVLVLGGHEVSIAFSDALSNLTPELFNPHNGTFTRMAPMAIPRTYHSVALLMPDARVFVAGGGLCGGCQTNHPNAQIFTPPYLLDSAGALRSRPRITGGATQLKYGGTSEIQTDRAIAQIALVRTASATHSVNTDQRRIPLSFGGNVTNGYTLQMPTNPGIAPPGNYMVFAIDSFGVPSEAHMVKLNAL